MADRPPAGIASRIAQLSDMSDLTPFRFKRFTGATICIRNFHENTKPRLALELGACLNSHCSILSESDSSLGYEQVFSPLEYRSDAASAAECAGLCAERPCLAVYR